jgi:uncharacterized membrane protein
MRKLLFVLLVLFSTLLYSQDSIITSVDSTAAELVDSLREDVTVTADTVVGIETLSDASIMAANTFWMVIFMIIVYFSGLIGNRIPYLVKSVPDETWRTITLSIIAGVVVMTATPLTLIEALIGYGLARGIIYNFLHEKIILALGSFDKATSKKK